MEKTKVAHQTKIWKATRLSKWRVLGELKSEEMANKDTCWISFLEFWPEATKHVTSLIWWRRLIAEIPADQLTKPRWSNGKPVVALKFHRKPVGVQFKLDVAIDTPITTTINHENKNPAAGDDDELLACQILMQLTEDEFVHPLLVVFAVGYCFLMMVEMELPVALRRIPAVPKELSRPSSQSVPPLFTAKTTSAATKEEHLIPHTGVNKAARNRRYNEKKQQKDENKVTV